MVAFFALCAATDRHHRGWQLRCPFAGPTANLRVKPSAEPARLSQGVPEAVIIYVVCPQTAGSREESLSHAIPAPSRARFPEIVPPTRSAAGAMVSYRGGAAPLRPLRPGKTARPTPPGEKLTKIVAAYGRFCVAEQRPPQ